jgi:hypothetical protein
MSKAQRERGAAEIYHGFFWRDPLPEVLSRVAPCDLSSEQVAQLHTALLPHLRQLSPHGWIPGIPNRTLILPELGIRLVYGGSIGTEIGIRSLDGQETKGFFLSQGFFDLLCALEVPGGGISGDSPRG